MLVLVRLPFLLCSVLLLVVVSAPRIVLLHTPGGALDQRCLEAPPARTVLLVMGYWSVPSAMRPPISWLRRTAANKQKNTRPMPVGSCVRAGDVIVSTATSPAEVVAHLGILSNIYHCC